MKLSISRAASVLRNGGVITCPTDGVFGLSCLPDMPHAVSRLLAIKQRDPAKGLILISASKEQLRDWIAIPPEQLPDPDPARPITWIVPASAAVSTLVRGTHSGIAVRITSNPTASALCAAVASPLVSTSANLAGQPVAQQPHRPAPQFSRQCRLHCARRLWTRRRSLRDSRSTFGPAAAMSI